MKKDFLFLLFIIVSVPLLGDKIYKNVFTDSTNVACIGRTMFGAARNVAVKDSATAFITTNRTLISIDVSDPSNPTIIGFYDITDGGGPYPDYITGLDVQGDYAYMSGAFYGGVLYILDVSDPSNIIKTSRIYVGDYAYDIKVSGNYAYIATYDNGIYIVDVSDPYNPVNAGMFRDSTSFSRVEVDSCYVYASADNIIYIADVSDPSNPSLIDSIVLTDKVNDMYFYNNSMYVADNDSGLCVIDLSDVNNPVIYGYYKTDNSAIAVSVYGDYAYVSNEKLSIIDVSDPLNMTEVGYYYEDYGSAARSVVLGDYCYLSYDIGGFKVIDVSDVSNPTKIGTYMTGGDDVAKIFIDNDYMYAVNYNNGLWIIDISDYQNPQYLGTCSIDNYVYDVVACNNYVYIADGGNGIYIVDATDPSNPQLIGRCDTLGDARKLCVYDNYLYIANGGAGFDIMDISDPSNPVNVGHVDIDSLALCVYVDSMYAYVGMNGGVRILNISDHSNPYEIARIDTSLMWSARSIYKDGNYLYFLTGMNLIIINVSDESEPYVLFSIFTAYENYEIWVSNGYAYIASFGNNMQVVKVSDPLNPETVGFYYVLGWFNDLFLYNNLIYVSDYYHGVYVLEFLGENYVDDYKDKTEDIFINSISGGKVNIAFTKAIEKPVNIEVYDTAGRRIYKDIVGVGSTNYNISLNSGIYFIVLKYDDIKRTYKVVNVR